VVFVLAFAGLWAWEALSAAGQTRGSRAARWRRNLTITAINFMLGGAGAALMLAASQWAALHRWGLAGLPQWPLWLVIVIGVLLIDLTDYARHRVVHRLPWLWRLHRVHHTDAHMDVTTTLRGHPLEQLLRPLFGAATTLLFGIGPLSLAVAALVQLPILLFQHADISLPSALDRALLWLIPTPALHRVHHSRQRSETDSNYGTALTLWDRLFGSFRAPPAAAPLGLDGFDDKRHQTVLGMLSTPWRSALAA
jgi:sterol desaturase/sphingolipid hydroxylase (fatty acid hydroxylase superfamily)